MCHEGAADAFCDGIPAAYGIGGKTKTSKPAKKKKKRAGSSKQGPDYSIPECLNDWKDGTIHPTVPPPTAVWLLGRQDDLGSTCSYLTDFIDYHWEVRLDFCPSNGAMSP
jgi:hypothetical protein